MADFEDITGWEEEVEQYFRDKAVVAKEIGHARRLALASGANLPPLTMTTPPRVPVSRAAQYIRICFKNPFFFEALDRIAQWWKENPDTLAKEQNGYPMKDSWTAKAFPLWFQYKSGLEPNLRAFGVATAEAHKLYSNYLPMPDDVEVLQILKSSVEYKNTEKLFDFSN